MHKLGLVQGGGGRGSYQIGVWKALRVPLSGSFFSGKGIEQIVSKRIKLDLAAQSDKQVFRINPGF